MDAWVIDDRCSRGERLLCVQLKSKLRYSQPLLCYGRKAQVLS